MRLCSGCQTKIPDGVRYCDACKAEHGETSDGIKSNTPVSFNGAYDAALDALRKGLRWQKRRAGVLKKNPWCARCGGLAEIVDHVVPAAEAIRQVRESKRFPFDPNAGYYLESNLQGLCRPCHGAKTTEDKAHVGAWPDVMEKHDAQPKKVWSF